MKKLLTRTLTGFFIVLIVLGGLWFHPLTFLLVVLTIVLGSQFELVSLVFGEEGQGGYRFKSLLLSVPAFLAAPYIAGGKLQPSVLLFLILLLIIIQIAELYRKNSTNHFESVSRVLLVAAYTTLPYILMIFSAFGHGETEMSFSPVLVISFFILLWINDTGAYLSGMLLGRNKMIERISPNKTWEGLAGGVILTMAAAWFATDLNALYSRTDWLIIGAVISLFASFGDLFESLLKRDAGVKDSGSVLPGHGGFLDRFDGVTFAFPVVYLYITFFG